MNTGLNIKTCYIFVLLSLLPFLISSCATSSGPSPSEIKGARFDEKPSEEYAREKITRYLETTLFDPYSAKLSCSPPSEKAWIKDKLFLGPHFGYLVHCAVNAKNQMGGYTGLTDFWFIFNGSEFLHVDPVLSKGLVQ